MAYCNLTTDLSDVYPEIHRYRTERRFEDWESIVAYSNTYRIQQTGYVEQVFDDGDKLSLQTSVALVNANGGWFYDSALDILYVHALDSDDLTSATIVITGGVDWATFLARIRNEASEDFDSFMNVLHPTPLMPRLIKIHSSNDYVSAVRDTVATMMVIKIMERLDPENEDITALRKKVRNPDPIEGEIPGVIDDLLNGNRVLQDQISAREVGSFNVNPDSGNGSTSHIWVLGKYTGSEYNIWRLEIDTAGVPGTATWKLSKDRGANWNIELQVTFNTDNNDRRIHIGSGIYVVFNPDGTFVDGDIWDIELFPVTDVATKSKISISKTTREDF